MDRNCGYGSVPHLALVGSYLGSAMAYNGQPQARPLIAAFCGLPCVLCLVYLNSKFFMLKVFYSMSCIILFRVRSSILTSSCYCKVSCKVCVFSFFFCPSPLFPFNGAYWIPFSFRPLLWGTESFLDMHFLSCLGKAVMCWAWLFIQVGKHLGRRELLRVNWEEKNNIFFFPFNLLMRLRFTEAF